MKKLALAWFIIGVIVIAFNTYPMLTTKTNPAPFDAQFQKFILDTHIVSTNGEKFSDDLSFLFIDFKYDNQIKICEFGTAKAAGLGDTPTTLQVNGTLKAMFTPYWPSFWYYLAHLNMPVWAVGTKPRDHKTEDLNIIESNNAWHMFTSMGGKHLFTLSDLEHERCFNVLQRKKRTDSHDNYHGIVIYKPTKNAIKEDYSAFKKKYPQFLYLDEVGCPYAVYKTLGASLFKEAHLQKYKPRWKIYQKTYTKTLAHEIVSDIASDIMVIKPINAVQGRGIIMVNKEDLDATLKHICKETPLLNMPTDTYEKRSHTYSHWNHDHHNTFLVEEYCPSQPLFIHDKWYDPTIRMYFTLRHQQEKIFVNVFGGYYKIPVKALTDEGTLTEKHKTVPYYKSDVALSGLTLPAELLVKITIELKEVLPNIYRQMLLKHTRK